MDGIPTYLTPADLLSRPRLEPPPLGSGAFSALSDRMSTVARMTATKHPDCDPCDCGAAYGDVHCRHAHQPWFGLSDDDKAILDFEAQHWTYPGAKETAIVQTFDMLAPRYYQRLNALLERPESLAYAPLLVKRLQRLRDRRRSVRVSTGVAP